MTIKTNYHTHSTFCDGKNTLEEMVQEAIKRDIKILGFSSHAMYPFSDVWHIEIDNYEAYCNEVQALKQKYADQIEICLGFEADYIKNLCQPTFEKYKQFNPDYILGSVHFVPGGTKEEGYYEADGNDEKTKGLINKLYGGNIKEAVIAYFEAERNMVKNSDFTFIGHPDLVRKQNSKSILFDENETWYKDELKKTAKAFASSGLCVEINTGGMARGYMTTTFPSRDFLSILHDNKVPVTINSDSHKTDTIDYGFDYAEKLAKEAGYTELCYLSSGSLKFQKI